MMLTRDEAEVTSTHDSRRMAGSRNRSMRDTPRLFRPQITMRKTRTALPAYGRHELQLQTNQARKTRDQSHRARIVVNARRFGARNGGRSRYCCTLLLHDRASRKLRLRASSCKASGLGPATLNRGPRTEDRMPLFAPHPAMNEVPQCARV